MTHHWDEFSKSLAEGSSTRRESLRLLGAALAGAVLGPLGPGRARAAPKPKAGQDPCKSLCRCSNKKQQDACLAACQSCTGATSRLCGSCGTGVICTDLAQDVRNCGACGNVCQPGYNEAATCVSGACVYSCAEGAVRCNGTCTFLYSDPNNCGACGNICGGADPSCYNGACSECTPYCPAGWCGGDGCGGECACPNGMYCESDGWCYDPCAPETNCDGVCTDLNWDSNNCGSCGNVCPEQFACAFGVCEGSGYYYY